MPTRRSLALEAAYQRSMAQLGQQTAQLVAQLWRGVDTESLGPSIRRMVPQVARTVELGKGRSRVLTAGFVERLAELEGQQLRAAAPAIARDGASSDGRPLPQVMSGVAPVVLVALRNGRSLDAALRFGGFVLARVATTEVLDAGRDEAGHQAERSGGVLEGWTWGISTQGGCGACLALADNATHGWDEEQESHPFCGCVRVPVVAGAPQEVERPTGAELYAAMSREEQVATFRTAGEEKADAIASGQLELGDLVQRSTSEEWHAILSEAPLS